MPEEFDAAENLRVIRKLMERSTIYRAISAPTALAAAILTIPTATLLARLAQDPDFHLSPLAFFGIWFAVYFLVDGFNTFLLWRDAKRRKTSMISPGLMHALASVIPPLFTGALLSLFLLQHSLLMATLCWVIFYGLALLATHSFAPTSIKTLGTFFLLAGLSIAAGARLGWINMDPDNQLRVSSMVMSFTFGLFHLTYALIIGLKTRFRISQSHDDPSLP